MVGGFRSTETVLDGGHSRSPISGPICSGGKRIFNNPTSVKIAGKPRRHVHFFSLTGPSLPARPSCSGEVELGDESDEQPMRRRSWHIWDCCNAQAEILIACRPDLR